MRAIAVYAVVVGILQVVFLAVPDDIAQLVLPIGFTLLALGLFWSVLHLWNREVVLYERGFTYREGSNIGAFFYGNIVKLQPKAERMAYFGVIRRTIYRYTLVTDQDETLQINNLYSDPDQLTHQLDKFITQARRRVIKPQIERGETVDMGETIRWNQQQLMVDGRSLAWGDFAGYAIRNKQIEIQTTGSDPIWATITLDHLDNPLLFISLLKDRRDHLAKQDEA